MIALILALSALISCTDTPSSPSDDGSATQSTTTQPSDTNDPPNEENKVNHPFPAPETVPAQILELTEFKDMAPNRLPSNLVSDIKAYVEGYSGEQPDSSNVYIRAGRMKSKKVYMLFDRVQLDSGDASSVFVPDPQANINIYLQGESTLESKTFVIHNKSGMDENNMDFEQCSTLRFSGMKGNDTDTLILKGNRWSSSLIGGRVIVQNCTLDLRSGNLSSYASICIEKGGRVIFPDGSEITLSDSIGSDVYFSCDYESRKCTVYSYSDSDSISLELVFSNGREISLSGKSSQLTFDMPAPGTSLNTEKYPCSLAIVTGNDKIFPSYSPQSGYSFVLPSDADMGSLEFKLTLGKGYTANILKKTYSESTGLTLDLSKQDTLEVTFISPEGKEKKVSYRLSLASVNVLSLNIDESLGTIDAMKSDKEKKTYCYGSLTYTATEGQHCFTSYFSIHGRGNATWDDKKKGYSLKLHQSDSYGEKNKVDISGMGESASWVLLANHRDRTLMRNALALTLAQKIGMKYAVEFVFVDLYMNGEYLGLYMLTEKIHTSSTQTDIPESKENSLEGGYLLEFDNYTDTPQFRLKKSGLTVTVTEPESLESYSAIEKFLNEAETAILDERGYNSKTKKYWYDYIDVTSFAQLWIVREYTMDYDATVNFRFYYDPSDQKLHAGPAWDFDNCMARTARIYADPYDALIETGDRERSCWLTRLMRHDDFLKEIQRLYNENSYLFDTESKDSIYALALSYYDSLASSIKANFEVWESQLYNKSWNTPEDLSYDGHFGILTDFIINRNKFWEEYIPSLS